MILQCYRECTNSVIVPVKQKLVLIDDVRNKLNSTIWCELKNKLIVVFAFFLSRCVMSTKIAQNHLAAINIGPTPWLQKIEIRLVKKSLLKRNPNNNIHLVLFAVVSNFFFYSFDRARKKIENKFYKYISKISLGIQNVLGKYDINKKILL